MKLNLCIAGLLLSFFSTQDVIAQTFPSKPIKIVVPFGAGGVADLTARTVAQKLSESMGQPVVIDNKLGAGGVAAGDLVAKANPGKLNLGSINMGSTQNLAAELFKSTSGTDLQIVPFNGTPAVITALRGGQIDAA